MFTALDTSDGPIEFATTGFTSLPLESIKPTIKFRWPWCVIVKMASPDSSSNGFVAICPFPERLIGAGSSAGAALCLFFSFLLAGSSFSASSLASEPEFVEDPPLLFSLPPPHNSTKTISNTRITTTPPMVRRTLLCGFCGGGGGGGTSDTVGVLILPGSGVGGGGPVGTSGSGRCAAPQLGQKFAVCLISVPQFSQKRLSPSIKTFSLLA